ncbi:hypothetical protein DPEC_G00276020 [Dallia pectoralis]|uniref:Uncharacterized protein n=1 Tax=Dallia pectoralis TaxID=75939 RepID=A0ACC2FLD7_DALPE|nr:hypothetical protein DPEC_G00276020 [Dallia pectoralis]
MCTHVGHSATPLNLSEISAIHRPNPDAESGELRSLPIGSLISVTDELPSSAWSGARPQKGTAFRLDRGPACRATGSNVNPSALHKSRISATESLTCPWKQSYNPH